MIVKIFDLKFVALIKGKKIIIKVNFVKFFVIFSSYIKKTLIQK